MDGVMSNDPPPGAGQIASSPEGVILEGKYEVGAMIGRGGCGAVHEGRHVELGRVVAIKLIDPELLENEEVVERFRREARATSAVQSDHIVQVFDVGKDPLLGLFMVMEQLVGEDLEATLAKRGALPVKLAVDIACQVARGLARAHAAGIVHRDLKPGNVFLTSRDDGTTLAKILDFGISKLLRPNAQRTAFLATEQSIAIDVTQAPALPGLTRVGTALGTPQYMSPEQAKGKAVDRRTDVWSLGAVLFEMLSGKPAYEEKARFEDTLRAIVDTPAPRLADVAPEVPRAIADVVAKALERNVDARISDCELFAKMLTEALSREDARAVDAPPIVVVAKDALPSESKDVDVTALAPSENGTLETSVEASSTPAVRRRRWLRAFALTFLALVTLGVGGAWMWRAGRLGAPSETDTTPAPSPSQSPSVSASTTPPKPPTKPAKPKPKPSSSAPAKSLTPPPPPSP
jgi:serine/threonine-protein kinase